jgi:hypothetical protein
VEGHQASRRSQVLLPGFPAYIELEAQAVLIRGFVAQLVPGLFQTEEYARAVMDPRLTPAALEGESQHVWSGRPSSAERSLRMLGTSSMRPYCTDWSAVRR